MNRVVGTRMTQQAKVWDGPIPGTHEPGFVEQPIIENLQHSRMMSNALDNETHVFTMGECRIILGHEPGGVHGELRWHLTVSCTERHPSWDEIKTARYRLLGPDLPVAMFLPPVVFYVNVSAQDHVFQVWEVEDPARVWESL